MVIKYLNRLTQFQLRANGTNLDGNWAFEEILVKHEDSKTKFGEDNGQ
jgi:hypothetical protein